MLRPVCYYIMVIPRLMKVVAKEQGAFFSRKIGIRDVSDLEFRNIDERLGGFEVGICWIGREGRRV
jgi:hypothetical protein